MSGLLAKKLAQQVTEIRSNPDNKRCFNCESLGTTYYVPQFSIFVCTSCSGIHMQFGHRVKSVTLADYKADEVQHMREGGNQVAAYKYLARYTPNKDLRKPLDKNPQRVRIWIQTVFIDKRFYSADAPVPRRSQDGAATASRGLTSPTGSLRRSSSSREGSTTLSPLPSAALASPPVLTATPSSRTISLPSTSPPVRDMRELLGNKATVLHVGPKQSSEPADSSAGGSAASSVSGLAPATAATTPQATPKPAAVPAFDPFAAPETPVTTPAMQAMPSMALSPAAQPQQAAAFDPFGQPAVSTPAAAMAPAAAAASNSWDAFGDSPAFGVVSSAPAVATPPAAAVPAVSATVSAAEPSSGWASFGDDAFSPAPPAAAAAVPPAASLQASASLPAVAGVAAAGITGGSSASAPASAAVAPAAVTVAPMAGATGGSAAAAAAAGSAPMTPSGSVKSGKAPIKELAADLFADVGHVPSPYQPAPGVMLQPPQQPGPAFAMAAGRQQAVPGMLPAQAGVSPQQMPYGMVPMGYAMPQQQSPMMQQQQALAWQQQQAAMGLQQQQQAVAWQQQQQVAMGMYGGVRLQGYPQQQQMPGMPYGMMAMNGAMMPGVYGAASGQMGAMQQQPQQQQPGTPASPSWTVNTTAAGITEEGAFADLVNLKKVLPAVGGTTAAPVAVSMGPGMVTSPPQQQQQMPYAMASMSAAPAASYTLAGAFASVPMAQQPMLGQQPQQQMPYAGQPGMGGMYAAAAPAVQPAAGFGLSPAAGPAASMDSGNPFA